MRQLVIPMKPSQTAAGIRARAAWLCNAFLLIACAHAGQAACAFGFDDVAHGAEQLAAAAYKKPGDTLPKELSTLTYDQYRDIRSRPEGALWRDAKLPFEIGFHHRGLYYDQPVKISEVGEQGVTEIKFDPGLFDYGANTRRGVGITQAPGHHRPCQGASVSFGSPVACATG